MIKRFEGLFINSGLDVGTPEPKKLLKLLAMYIGLVRNLPLPLTIVFEDSQIHLILGKLLI